MSLEPLGSLAHVLLIRGPGRSAVSGALLAWLEWRQVPYCVPNRYRIRLGVGLTGTPETQPNLAPDKEDPVTQLRNAVVRSTKYHRGDPVTEIAEQLADGVNKPHVPQADDILDEKAGWR